VLDRPEETVLVVGHALCVRYVVDAAQGLLPAPLMAPVGNTEVFILSSDAAAAAAELLDEWSRAPVFRPLHVRAQLSND
jgi:broad specificity phosphatase PhoE